MPLGHQQITGNINSFNVSTSYNDNRIVNFVTETAAERYQILQWLSPLEPQKRHQDVRAERVKGVGNWVLEIEGFRKWRDAEDDCVEPVLFCSGNPGVGKTYLSSLVIDSLCDQAGGEDIAVVGLYCDFLAQQEQSTASMLGAILKQLVTRGEIPGNIRVAFQKAKKEFGGRSLLPPDQVEILKKALTSLPRVFICIDALDESTPKHRRELLQSLREIVRVSPNTRIFLTGRSHIDDEISECFSKTVRIPISPTQDDIKSYLEMRLDGDTDSNAMNDKLRADIMRVIPEKISEVFLLASLNIDAILGEITLHQRRRKLEKVSKGEGLGDAYAGTLSRVKAQQRSRSKLGMKVLMWVSHSERPLHVDESCHALGVEEGSTDLNTWNAPAIETLLACCMGLVTVDKSSSTVRLIHYTLQEYLSHNSNLFLKPHSMIAETCLTYLNFRQVRGFPPSLRSVPPTIPFASYASCHSGTHATREMTDSVKTHALKLLDGYDKHISSKMLILHGLDSPDQPLDREDTPRGFTGLQCAAFLGCAEITAALLEMHKWDMQATDFHGNTAIAWAARRGHEAIVKILLDRKDVDPNIADTKYGRTPLSWAAGNGHEGVVRILLEQSDVNHSAVDTQHDRTPLSWAAVNGHEGVVRILLGRSDVNPNIADTRYGQTPLSLAAEYEHEGVLRILLERNDVDPNTVDPHFGRTALSWAAEYGREGVVRILLGRDDVDPNTVDTHLGRTPLLWAAGNGHEAVVGTLLERDDVNPNAVDTYSGRTPLSRAAVNGHEGVVRKLLERNGVNPDAVDAQHGRTPLSWAAENGHGAVVSLLLERNDVNPSAVDPEYGRTPLSWAAGGGHERVVRILMGGNDVNPSAIDTQHGRTPLSWAAGMGQEGVVRLLLESYDVRADTADKEYGGTPLSWAAEYGHKEVVKILLGRNEVNPNRADTHSGRTPLSCAAGNGHEDVVRILLERNDVNPSLVDTLYGRTPLSWASGKGHEGVVRMLLERNDVNPNTVDTHSGRTPLSWAAENGHEGVVRIFLERNDVNPNTVDTHYGRTPHQWALGNGYARIAKLLQEHMVWIPRYIELLPQTELLPKPPMPSEPPSKRRRIGSDVQWQARQFSPQIIVPSQQGNKIGGPKS